MSSKTRQRKKAATVREVSDWYGITQEHILKWIATKKIKAINIANTSIRPRWRIPIKPLEAFLESRSNQTGETDKKSPKRRKKPSRQFV